MLADPEGSGLYNKVSLKAHTNLSVSLHSRPMVLCGCGYFPYCGEELRCMSQIRVGYDSSFLSYPLPRP